MSITIPRSAGQLPCYYNRKPSMFRNYVLAESAPLYPFGYGRSYTAFEYKNLKITPAEIPSDGSAEASVDVTNTGRMRGDEIVQLYIRDVVSFPTRPVMELKDFARISLNPGETQTVRFLVGPDKLESSGVDMKRRVQPGNFEIMAGKSSVEFLKAVLKVR